MPDQGMAETLHAAAGQLRQCARAAKWSEPGPWALIRVPRRPRWRYPGQRQWLITGPAGLIATVERPNVARHFMCGRPDVALAFADLLEAMAAETERPSYPNPDTGAAALKVARAVLVKGNTGDVGVTPSEVRAARLIVRRNQVRGRQTPEAIRKIADADGSNYQRPGWGSLRGRLIVSDDWDSREVNDEIGRPFREGDTDA